MHLLSAAHRTFNGHKKIAEDTQTPHWMHVTVFTFPRQTVIITWQLQQNNRVIKSIRKKTIWISVIILHHSIHFDTI
jgi:hypothetical protein